MSLERIYDYIEANYRVFAIHSLLPGGKCGCGRADCHSAGKHPVVQEWQRSPAMRDDESIEAIASGTGFGVVVDNHLIIDIDPRNGGTLSYNRLSVDLGIDFKGTAGLVVRTGGGGWHIYYKRPPVALKGKLKDYPGIDFKSSGYVVGAGSIHATGAEYEVERGAPGDETMAPDALLRLLEKPSHYRGDVDGESVEVDEAQLIEMLGHIDPDADYEIWVSIGMAIHHATQGAGIEIFDKWSSAGSKYRGFHEIDGKWHSFSDHPNPVTLGTIFHYAEEGGYTQPISNCGFAWAKGAVEEAEQEVEEDIGDHPFSIANVDLTSPPGFVGKLAEWINRNSRFPRRHLAVAAALTSIGNIAGMRFTDDVDGADANMFSFCVAGSGTGKESVQQAITEIHRAAGVSAAIHGGIKSEQEITRNLLRHQAAYYVIDELGYLLSKIANAQSKGSSSYLEGIIALLMSAYSKASGFLLVSGDIKEAERKELLNKISFINKKLENNDLTENDGRRIIGGYERALDMLDTGIERPFLSMIGFTTPVSFDSLVTAEQATNGFIARSLIFREHDTNPKRRPGFKKEPLPQNMAMTLVQLYAGGTCDPVNTRVEYYGERKVIPTTGEARAMLDQVYEWFHGYAGLHVEVTGLEAIVRRAYEMVTKVSLILSIPGGLREAEHVRFAYAIVRRDIEGKIHLAHANRLSESVNADDRAGALASRVMGECSYEEGITRGVLVNRCTSKRFSRRDVEEMIDRLRDRGSLIETESKHARNGKMIKSYTSSQ